MMLAFASLMLMTCLEKCTRRLKKGQKGRRHTETKEARSTGIAAKAEERRPRAVVLMMVGVATEDRGCYVDGAAAVSMARSRAGSRLGPLPVLLVVRRFARDDGAGIPVEEPHDCFCFLVQIFSLLL
jgi:hypothetical protein